MLTLERICKTVSYPKAIRIDLESEFVSRDLDLRACQKGVVLDFSCPSKPKDNSFIQSFNGKFRSEWLNAHWFLNFDDAGQKIQRSPAPQRDRQPSADSAVERLIGAPASMSLTPENTSSGWPSFGERFRQRPESQCNWTRVGGNVRTDIF